MRFFDIVLVVLMLGVAGALGLGVLNMARGGSPARSQRLMRWRVGLQAGALVAVVLVLWLRG
ncbi:twin transmembrane helix small protein [Pinisolibacter sp.]|uniref:twin transmembrane helix small protein n=1 Tax=Pinisolibacter sp. TaxID=2172024 RepID=UPI002FDE1D50